MAKIGVKEIYQLHQSNDLNNIIRELNSILARLSIRLNAIQTRIDLEIKQENG